MKKKQWKAELAIEAGKHDSLSEIVVDGDEAYLGMNTYWFDTFNAAG